MMKLRDSKRYDMTSNYGTDYNTKMLTQIVNNSSAIYRIVS